MLKDFITWINFKINLQNSGKPKPFKEREIWWCSLGVNVGIETDGKNEKFNRPVLIIKKFNQHQFWGIPLTSQIKEENDFYFKVLIKQKVNYVCLTQMRVFDVKRLNNPLDKDYKLPLNVFNEILEKLCKFLEFREK